MYTRFRTKPKVQSEGAKLWKIVQELYSEIVKIGGKIYCNFMICD